ncbi:MAG: ribonuclease P protein component [Mycoplasmoidaceae bacterium]|nr:ribonuclease P protein component [Mycoplasmoidaceae bacterium]
MKDKASTVLTSIKTNQEIVQLLKRSKKWNLPCLTLWLSQQSNKSQIDYALLVNKTQFKHAVTRNKIKRQLRSILINSDLKGGIKVLIKPNSIYLKKTYLQIKESLIKIIKQYQNGK